MYTDSDWTKAISKLTEITIEGKIKWNVSKEYEIEGDRKLNIAYIARHEDTSYIVSSFQEKYWTDEDQYYWTEEVDFEIWKSDGYNHMETRIAVSPKVPAIYSLFKAVQGRFAKDQNALKFLLSDNDGIEFN